MAWIGTVHLLSMGAIFSMVGMLLAAVILQNKKQVHRIEVLATLAPPIQGTAYFKQAGDYLRRRTAPNGNSLVVGASAISMWFLICVIFGGALITFFGAEWFKDATTPNYVFGGGFAPKFAVDVDKNVMTDLQIYQSSTVFTGAMAFIGAYIWTVSSLLTRQCNDDITSSTYYFLALRIITAVLVASVARHFVEAIPGTSTVLLGNKNGPMGLAIMGFMIGWSPTLWLNQLLTWGFQKTGIADSRQKAPNKENYPSNLSLSLIQGLTDERIERIDEIDIDNVQKLASENPILIWLKTPYNMDLIVDWVAQAQLCQLYEDGLVKALRAAGLRDIFSFVAAAVDPVSAAGVQKILNIDAGIIARGAASVQADPTYRKLIELRAALSSTSTNLDTDKSWTAVHAPVDLGNAYAEPIGKELAAENVSNSDVLQGKVSKLS